MKSILDKGFKYTPSFATDIRKTMERCRKRLEKTPTNVTNIKPRKEGKCSA